jgi:hypothetical protein
MKITTTLITALIALSGHSLASSLLITAAEDTFFAYEGAQLDTQFSVTGGWYDVNLGLDFATISSNFITAGSAIAFPYAGNPTYNGYVAGNTGTFNSNTLGIEGLNVFWLVTDGTTAFALLEDTGVQYKLETAIPNSNDSFLNAGNLGQFIVHAGSTTDTTSVNLAAIPEPSTFLLSGVAMLGLLRRRRS